LSLTDYQASYFAHALTRRFPPDSVEKITIAFAGAQVDLNPHQIDAALFAFKSPLSRGDAAGRQGGVGENHRGGPGVIAEMGRAQAAHPCHHALQPSQAVGALRVAAPVRRCAPLPVYPSFGAGRCGPGQSPPPAAGGSPLRRWPAWAFLRERYPAGRPMAPWGRCCSSRLKFFSSLRFGGVSNRV
jgi:hypothetical protein